MPKKGENTAPIQVSEPKATRYSTEPVAVRMYQPRISASVSKPTEVARSAGHWKRKLRTWNGASAVSRVGQYPRSARADAAGVSPRSRFGSERPYNHGLAAGMGRMLTTFQPSGVF